MKSFMIAIALMSTSMLMVPVGQVDNSISQKQAMLSDVYYAQRLPTKSSPNQEITVESASGGKDLIQYRIRRGNEVRTVVLRRLRYIRLIALFAGNQGVRAIAVKADAATRNGSRPMLLEFRRRRDIHNDEFTQDVLDDNFIASLPLPPRSESATWKSGFSFVNAASRQRNRKALILQDQISKGHPNVMAGPISDFFCNLKCLDSVCAGCVKALCDVLKCLESDLGLGHHSTQSPKCDVEWSEFYAVCGGFAD